MSHAGLTELLYNDCMKSLSHTKPTATRCYP